MAQRGDQGAGGVVFAAAQGVLEVLADGGVQGAVGPEQVAQQVGGGQVAQGQVV